MIKRDNQVMKINFETLRLMMIAIPALRNDFLEKVSVK